MGKVLELLKSAKDKKEMKEMLEECRLLTDDLSLELIRKAVIEECPFLNKCTNQNTSKCTDCLGGTGRKNYIRKDDEVKAVEK